VSTSPRATDDPTDGRSRSSLFRSKPTDRLQRQDEPVDELTGLPERRTLVAAFEEAVRLAPPGVQVALGLIDLRDFKRINQMFGRDDGDLVLASVVQRLSNQLGRTAPLVRLGGDEFAVITTCTGGLDAVDDLAVLVIEALRMPFEIRTYTVHVGVNLGFAIVDPGADDLASATKRADTALYRSKLQGPYRYEVYEQSLHSQVSPAAIVDWLRSALDSGDLRLVYQPIHTMSGDLVVAVEALLRWDHPTEGPLLPDVVLPALEDSGLIVEVGNWVIDEACRQARIWRDATPHGMPPIVFVNISPRQLLSSEFLPSLEAAIERHGIDSNQLCLELGNMSTIPETSQAWMLLRECKALGVRLALDNFGSNDSSYGLIRKLQLDYIKLGRQLTSARGSTAHDDAITNSVVSLARSLGFTTIAQGIEDPASLERARTFGCDLAQGFYFGVAEPADAIDLQIATGRSTSRAVFR
jgi:diguanylate cyclase (GGDEF)-like protein